VDLDEGLWSSGGDKSELQVIIGSCSSTYEKSSFGLALSFCGISEELGGLPPSPNFPGELAIVLESSCYLVS
jgi:hypothetical protein